jgi:hypothetical protein
LYREIRSRPEYDLGLVLECDNLVKVWDQRAKAARQRYEVPIRTE